METNETAKGAQYQAAEQELLKLLQEVDGLEEGDLKGLEQTIYQGIFNIGRKVMEGRMRKGPGSEPVPTTLQGECGHQQTLVSYRSKKLVTLFGEVEWKRAYYQCQVEVDTEPAAAPDQAPKCSHGRAPADETWGVQGTRTSPGVQQYISYLCAMLTLEEAAETFARLLPLRMSARQALNLMQPVGQALAQREDEAVKALFEEAAKSQTSEEQASQQSSKDIDRLYIELDGILARIRRGSVPMEEQERQRKGDVYREMKVGAVFLAERGRERSELAPEVWVDTPKEDSLRYVARRTAKGGFGQLLYTLAVQSGLSRAKQVVVLGDGAPWIWKLVAEHFPGAVEIVDLYHAQQHVWEVAHAVFGPTSQQAYIWAKEACTLLVQGRIEDLVTAIGKLPTIPPAPEESRSVPDKAVDYFTTNAGRMRYPAFRAQGMHVGSGIAEAACKTVVETRAKRTGMRWTPEGLDALLPLRTAKLNHTYDEFWEQPSRLVA
jgi:hypothetical protein